MQKIDSISHQLEDFFKAEPSILIVILFGSFASNRTSPSSDVDVAAMSLEPMSSDRLVSLGQSLAEKLKREVDLIDLSVAHGSLIQEILTKGKVILCKNPSLYESLLNRMLREREDDGRVFNTIVELRKKLSGKT